MTRWFGMLGWAGCAATPGSEAPTDDTVETSDPFETGIPRTGCDDPALEAAFADRAVGWKVAMTLPEGAKTAGDTFTFDLTDPASGGSLMVMEGERVIAGFCTDVLPSAPAAFTRTWQAARGTVTLRVTRDSEAWDPVTKEARFDAQVEVTDLVVIHDDLACAAPDLSTTGSLGWTSG